MAAESNMIHDLRIGTAGWSVPGRHAAGFPAEGTHLERYAGRMNAAEINSCFYRPHRRATYEKWAACTPPDFAFSVKLPKVLTHEQRLHGPYDALDRFADEIAGLGAKLGCVLVQTPPSLTFDAALAGRFFDAVRARIDAPLAFEPRHAAWFADRCEAWLEARRIARVAADPARPDGAGAPGGWPGLVYLRLHGSPKMYFSGYQRDFLEAQARLIAAWRRRAPVWCILDNTGAGHALGDALAVQELT